MRPSKAINEIIQAVTGVLRSQSSLLGLGSAARDGLIFFGGV